MFSSGSLKRAALLVDAALFVPGGSLLLLAALLANRARRTWPSAFAARRG